MEWEPRDRRRHWLAKVNERPPGQGRDTASDSRDFTRSGDILAFRIRGAERRSGRKLLSSDLNEC